METGVETGRHTLFGELLRRQRVAAGLTQEELAELAGLSVRGLRYLERGLHRPYRDTVQRLVDALDLPDEIARRLVTAARPRTAPVAGTRVRRALPLPPTPIVGRERDVAAVTNLLAEDSVRLVTLTGPGGVGKTRLALAVAALPKTPFTGGVVWVPLAALTDSTLVVSVIAQSLGLAEAGTLPLLDAVTASLRDQSVLLLLDNFEHVAAAATPVSELMAACPQLKVVVTSRAPLRLRTEHQFPVVPLRPPDATSPVSVYALAANPAVELFLRQAQTVRPDFALTEGNADAVAAICRRLEGLPLALELAAARIRVLPPAAMLARLEHQLTFLTGGPRDAPTRQRTMRETIGWSYELLDSNGAELFRRLAVFCGGCTLSAIEELCEEAAATQLALLDGIEELQRNSLLELADSPDDEPRFRMLQTIREYALERLGVGPEEGELRRRHARYYLSFVEEAARGFYSPGTALWLDRVQLEQDNLRAALTWCLEERHAELGLRLAAALWWFWYVRGHVTEGRMQLARLLALSEDPALAAVRAEALLGAGQLAQTQGDYAAAKTWLQESVAIHRELGDQRGTAAALLAAGFVARLQEEYETATALLEEGLALGRATGHDFVTAATLHHLGMIDSDVHEDFSTSRHRLEESLTLYRGLGLPRFVALVLLSLGDLALLEGDHPRARELLHDSLVGLEQVGERLGIHGALDSMAQLAAATGEPERAVRLAGAAERLRAISGTQSWPVVKRSRERWLTVARRTLEEATFQTAWAEGQMMTRQQAISYALEGALRPEVPLRPGVAVRPEVAVATGPATDPDDRLTD